jgi:hypothetical protein
MRSTDLLLSEGNQFNISGRSLSLIATPTATAGQLRCKPSLRGRAPEVATAGQGNGGASTSRALVEALVDVGQTSVLGAADAFF